MEVSMKPIKEVLETRLKRSKRPRTSTTILPRPKCPRSAPEVSQKSNPAIYRLGLPWICALGSTPGYRKGDFQTNKSFTFDEVPERNLMRCSKETLFASLPQISSADPQHWYCFCFIETSTNALIWKQTKSGKFAIDGSVIINITTIILVASADDQLNTCKLECNV